MPNKTFKDGYQIGYSSNIVQGMSGGAVLDKDGRVVGIHGLAEGETALDSQDSSSGRQVQLGYSLGIAVNTFLGLAKRFEIKSQQLQIEDNRPTEFSQAEKDTFEAAILSIEIPQGNAQAAQWLERGNQLWRLQRHQEAGQAFDRAIALNPEFIHLAFYGKGLALVYREEYQAALTSLERSIDANPNFTPAYQTKNTILQKLNRFDEALVAIEKAISLQNDNANLHNVKGIILSNLKRYPEAKSDRY